MLKMMDKPIAILFAALCLISCIPLRSVAASQPLPPNWPWRGVVVSSSTPPDADDMQYLREIGVNAVSIHLQFRDDAGREKISGREAFKKDLEWVDAFLDECKRSGVTVVISTAQIPMDPSTGLTQTSPEFWDNPELLKEAVYVAGELARRFKDRGAELGAYSILSEPVVIRDNIVFGKKFGTGGSLPRAWPGLMKDVIKEIRRYDKTRFISVTPGLWGLPAGYADFKPLDDPHIIYEAHMYQPHAFTHQGIREWPLGVKYPGRARLLKYWDKDALEGALEPLTDFQKRYGVPVWIGEFSAVRWAEGGDEYLKDLIAVFDARGLAWTYHCFKCWNGWDPDYAGGGATYDLKDWKRFYKGRDTDRWRLLKEAFGKNRLKGSSMQ
ncbi:MAG: cellulase family glycosylhydrolase [Deltaproteobacteria bacterium]|nr:cellulase family glycosylhydrolase [Deltaproteobacteria bacterium]